MLLPRNECFVGCKKDSLFVASSSPQLAPIFACQVLSVESENTGEEDVQQAASTFRNAMEDQDLKRPIDVWKMPPGFSIMQSFPLHTLYHPLPYYIEYALYG